MSEACERHTLAEGGLGKVEQCSCGLIHLEVAAVTLRLEPGAFRELAGTLGCALQQLGGVQAPVAEAVRSNLQKH